MKPTYIQTEVRRVSAELLSGNQARIDAFADEMLAAERANEESEANYRRQQEEAAIAALEDAPLDWQAPLTPDDINRMAAIEQELRTEGRVMRPFRTNPHD